MNCFSCNSQLEAADSVQLLCSCLETICQNCARDQLVSHPGCLESYIECPQCKTRITADDGIILGLPIAMEEEHTLVRYALWKAKKDHSESAPIRSYTKLHDCLKELHATIDPRVPEVQPLNLNRSQPNHQANQAMALMRRQLSLLALPEMQAEDSNVLDPVKYIHFQPNKAIEQYLAGIPADSCSLCESDIATGDSVLLTCPCEGMICRTCALRRIARQPSTFHQCFLKCPKCSREEKNVVRNQTALAECETALVRSGETYFSECLLGSAAAVRDKEKGAYRRLLDMLRWYWCMGLHGELKEECFGKGRTTKPTLQQVRLEAAQLEERRLNSSNLAKTYNIFSEETINIATTRSRLPLGFLRGADLRQNGVFERLYREVASLPIATNHGLARVQATVENACEHASLTAVEFLLLVSLRNYPGKDLMAVDAAQSTAAAVEVRVMLRAFLSLFTARALPKRISNEIVTRVFTIFTVQRTKEALDRLVSFEYLKITWAITPKGLDCIPHFEDLGRLLRQAARTVSAGSSAALSAPRVPSAVVPRAVVNNGSSSREDMQRDLPTQPGNSRDHRDRGDSGDSGASSDRSHCSHTSSSTRASKEGDEAEGQSASDPESTSYRHNSGAASSVSSASRADGYARDKVTAKRSAGPGVSHFSKRARVLQDDASAESDAGGKPRCINVQQEPEEWCDGGDDDRSYGDFGADEAAGPHQYSDGGSYQSGTEGGSEHGHGEAKASTEEGRRSEAASRVSTLSGDSSDYSSVDFSSDDDRSSGKNSESRGSDALRTSVMVAAGASGANASDSDGNGDESYASDSCDYSTPDASPSASPYRHRALVANSPGGDAELWYSEGPLSAALAAHPAARRQLSDLRQEIARLVEENKRFVRERSELLMQLERQRKALRKLRRDRKTVRFMERLLRCRRQKRARK